nr:MAG TPA: hypothetical protein [Caudoviricetes sp.]
MPGVTLRPKSNLQGNRCKPVPFFYTLKNSEKTLLTFLLLQYIIVVATEKKVNKWLLKKAVLFQRTPKIICFG